MSAISEKDMWPWQELSQQHPYFFYSNPLRLVRMLVRLKSLAFQQQILQDDCLVVQSQIQ